MDYAKYAVIILALLILAGGCKKSSEQSEGENSAEGEVVKRAVIAEYDEEYPAGYESDFAADAEADTEDMTVEVVVLSNWIARQAEEQTGISVRGDEIAMYGIVRSARKALEELETQEQTQVSVSLPATDGETAEQFEMTVTRKMVEKLFESD